jgi:amidase
MAHHHGRSADPLTAAADATTIAAAVNAGEVHPREVVAAAIARTETADAQLGLLVEDRYEQALSEAESVGAGRPLAGVPILLKDFLATCAGARYTEGSWYLENWVAPQDSEYVTRLRRAGVVILGIARTPELAILSNCETLRYGTTLNPRAPGLTTGGSSGASAAAVAAGAVPAAHGNDAGGSLRIPASCCGVLGLKPTRGRNPLGPQFGELYGGIVAEHVITRSASDSAAFLDATHGPAPGDPYAAPAVPRLFRETVVTAPRRLRIAVRTTTPRGEEIDVRCARATTLAAEALERLGHYVVPGAPEFDVDTTEIAFFDAFCAGVAAHLDDLTEQLGRAPTEDELEPYTRGIVERGRATTGPRLFEALTRLHRSSRRIAAFFERIDVWLTPTLASLPVPLGHFEIGPGETAENVLDRDARFSPFAWIANVTGEPAFSYPSYATAESLPVGVHFLGRFGDEGTLLALAAELESVLPPRPASSLNDTATLSTAISQRPSARTAREPQSQFTQSVLGAF